MRREPRYFCTPRGAAIAARPFGDMPLMTLLVQNASPFPHTPIPAHNQKIRAKSSVRTESDLPPGYYKPRPRLVR